MKITVIALIVDRFFAPRKWLIELPPMVREDAAEAAFAIMNGEALSPENAEVLANFPRPDKCRSLSVGDILIIQDHERPEIRHVAHVAGVGFEFH